MATVLLPSSWQEAAGGVHRLTVDATDVAGLLEALVSGWPGLAGWLRDDRGQVPGYVNIYVNGQDVRILAEWETPLAPEDEVLIIPAISGGAGGRHKSRVPA